MNKTELLTTENFRKELATLSKDSLFNVESDDSGSIFLSLTKCKLEINLDFGEHGELVIFKPYTEMEVRIDFGIVDEIVKEDGTYRVEFSNGISDVTISRVME